MMSLRPRGGDKFCWYSRLGLLSPLDADPDDYKYESYDVNNTNVDKFIVGDLF